MRKIPAAMASQHPDHAGKPYWHTADLIRTIDETRECFLSFSQLGIQEYKWDWEGKFVDESVIERLLSDYYDFFAAHPLGDDKFLTFRLPNPKVETEFRLSRAFMVLLTASGLARQIGFSAPPLFEVILPMTESAAEIIAVQDAFREMAALSHPLHRQKNGTLRHIEVIPLFEQVSTIARSARILDEYLSLHQKAFGFLPNYLRPYLARSDPALNSGLVPTVLAIKIALSDYRRFERSHSIRLFPILGSGSLPFRGGLTPSTVGQFIHEYAGVRTALLQSAFRYDFPQSEVIPAVSRLAEQLPLTPARLVSPAERQQLSQLMTVFESPFRASIAPLAPLINQLASQLPPRRERVQHTGLFGYSRGIGKVKLPRAIGFTAALYSLGIPPEIIGTGRGLKTANVQELLPPLTKFYVHLREDLIRAGWFLNKPLLKKLSRTSPAFKDILTDVKFIEEILGLTLGPQSSSHEHHRQLSDEIYRKLEAQSDVTSEITQAAILRQSLG